MSRFCTLTFRRFCFDPSWIPVNVYSGRGGRGSAVGLLRGRGLHTLATNRVGRAWGADILA